MRSPLSRRRFLKSSAVGAVGLAAAGFAHAGQERKKADPFGGFTVGVQSYTFRQFNLEQTLQRIQELGLHFVELYRGHLPVNAADDAIKSARNLCFKYDITPIAFGVEGFSKDNAANRRIFEFARKLGVRYLSADPSPDSFDSLDKLVGEFGIGIAIHPHGPTGKALHRWYSAEVILKAVERHHRLIGTCLDTGHLIRAAQDPFNRKLDPAQQVRHMGQRNFGLHLKDHDNAKRTDVIFGRGVLNVAEVLRALREVKFQGYISIEYEANANNPSPDVRACLDVFRESVRKLG
ncbi:MAG: sugar phosphate isomerase/epimerase [Gemmataceae bacterium]|nr:sugar phosphate isomerase/epimerase [Gemmataceae bacterium]MCI0742542.1 sugar phosphate isomerase/epimerase [Gemmataceae bacterium]